jgi:hypothetical protein
MKKPPEEPMPGDRVVLVEIPSGLLDGLPLEDQVAIGAIVGKPVLLVAYDKDGRAELQFDQDPVPYRHTHTIGVEARFIRPAL